MTLLMHVTATFHLEKSRIDNREPSQKKQGLPRKRDNLRSDYRQHVNSTGDSSSGKSAIRSENMRLLHEVSPQMGNISGENYHRQGQSRRNKRKQGRSQDQDQGQEQGQGRGQDQGQGQGQGQGLKKPRLSLFAAALQGIGTS